MIERIVYIGQYNNYKSNELFNKSVDYLEQNKGHKFYYILPNGKLLVKYRRAILEEVGQVFDLNLFTFDNIVDRLLKDDFYTYIDGETKEALLTDIFIQFKKEKINFYKDISSKKGFVKIVANIIGELKRSLVSPEQFLNRCPRTPFYTEIGLVYMEYERRLHDLGLIDREGSFRKSLDLLKKDNSFFNGLDFIIIDYFFDFRPQELELLKEIMKTNCSIYINMPFNRDENFNTFNRTIDILKSLEFKIEKLKKRDLSYYEQLASVIFNDDEKILAPNSNINVIRVANSYLEMKKVAEEIKRYYVNGIYLNDMAIVLTNPSEYTNKMFQVFEEEGIPCTLDKEINLIEIPLLEELLHILEVKKNGMDDINIINRIKSAYFPLCNPQERDAMEYILRKQDFNSSFIENIEDIKFTIEQESECIPQNGSVKEYVEAVSNILDRFNIEERILDIYKLTEDYNLLNRDFTAVNKFKEILSTMDKFLSRIYVRITIDEFLNILKDYLQKESIVEMEGNTKGINILSPVSIRGQRYKIVFVVGLSQDDYPNIVDRNFFFRENNYKQLREIGIDVKNYYEKLDKESIVFSTIISACSDILYLSYSQDSTENEKGIPSIFLDEILNRIQGDKIEEKVNVIDVDIDYILKDEACQLTTKRELSQYLLRKYYEGESVEELFQMFNDLDGQTFKEVNTRILCEFEREKEGFNEYSGMIEDDNVKRDIDNIQRDKIYSISYLESYGKCPYYFLLNNIMNVKEMERIFQDFTPLDRGSINHEVLKEYYFNYSREIEDHVLGNKEFDVDETYDFIHVKIEEKIKSENQNMNSAIWKLRVDNNTNRLLDFIKSDLDRLTKLKKKVLPYNFEVPFGRRNLFELRIGDLKIRFTGVIDRIDKYVDEDKYILIDYKNSAYSVKDIDQMKSGLSLQLPIYILTQKDKNIVAAMYGIISNGEFKVKVGNIDEKHLVTKKNKGALTAKGLEELLNISKTFIKTYIESISKGDFSVNPMECSSFCIYKDICRYEDVLEGK
ncbi:PD-(D/E)XK nuclease family protein [Schnuerera sp. xch1]|uniref:PD-(D/E)XK nuclease family protein n=1 Tax=Schnuerera sp. xch1 TaxID=2874283 RepID=UPI001CBB6F5E|nr:PD-(D/E)XK nuclease family protein [Schnuerera sp. xch1]MBZ2174494.1 PD-(D/E)XK nuclease family protein [Schnuerera sp. xch1]